MRVDVSEIKAYKGCKRSWELSSRNRFHLAPLAPKETFFFGTLMHEALHMLYLGGADKLDSVIKATIHEIAESEKSLRNMMINILTHYTDEVLIDDLERFTVLDIEHGFNFEMTSCPDIQFCGSIDMIVLDPAENKIYGFEHKSAKTFRDTFQLRLDEQPRLYTEALLRYIDDYNAKKGTSVTLGGIYVNQVRKTIKIFQHQRTLLTYTDADRNKFLMSLQIVTDKMKESMCDDLGEQPPHPSYMGCTLCDFRTICEEYCYESIDPDEMLSDFEDEFAKREVDHLDEKLERHGANDNLIEVKVPGYIKTYAYSIDEPVEIGEAVTVEFGDEIKLAAVVSLSSDYKGTVKKARKCIHE